MNGATAELWAKIINTPKKTIITIIGINQYCLDVFKNNHNSLMMLNLPIVLPHLLKLL